MLTRRTFAVCALCAAGGFLATGVEAEQAPPAGLKRTLLKETDGPTPGFVTVEMKVEIEPGVLADLVPHPKRRRPRRSAPQAGEVGAGQP